RAPHRQSVRLRRRENLRRSQESAVPEWDDARLPGIAHAVRVRLREPQREEGLRLRNVFFGVMQPPSNYFDFFGLPHKLNLDAADLESRFYALSKQWHPDKFARGTAEEKQISETATATLNDGYRTLKDPVSRAEYLLKERGIDAGQKSNKMPPELLDEVFDLNSALEEVENSRDQLQQFKRKFAAMCG